MYVALIRKFTRTAEGGVWRLQCSDYIWTWKYDMVREKSGKSQGILYCLGAGNPAMSKWKKNQIIGSLAATNFAPVFSFKSKFHFLIKIRLSRSLRYLIHQLLRLDWKLLAVLVSKISPKSSRCQWVNIRKYWRCVQTPSHRHQWKIWIYDV